MKGFWAKIRGPAGPLVERHTLVVRLSHWINAGCLIVLFMSGLQIFNAHPALYWGKTSDFDHPLLSMTAEEGANGIKGVTTIGDRAFNTTGLFGASESEGMVTARGFPAWATLPGPQWLAMGRLWHFAFAWIFILNGLVFALWAVARRHLTRDLLPKGEDWRALPRDILDHLRLRFAHTARYNVLQKISYTVVIFGLGPLVLLTGLTMSPTMDAAVPGLLALFGGRQSARTIHFLCAFSFFGFFLIHIAMVILSGAWNNLRSMITGRYRVTEEDHG
ncbi:thiosulfate reductase cytochrome b subunit [Rhizomicrobium palustre]|uniref:Thiosulfate reductase cytochrome b subunit n=1 Tax=Rhizomicrobium palustre TaxID=189966 RepID=A0A846MZX4_9PROT|nr:cytochrome b/b6 domain-containing protein [Rhizomicrobium palustre]NIK88487.1 thiosulfate reductase cytochrome b subunit [Rhizomicrobium palustre]